MFFIYSENASKPCRNNFPGLGTLIPGLFFKAVYFCLILPPGSEMMNFLDGIKRKFQMEENVSDSIMHSLLKFEKFFESGIVLNRGPLEIKTTKNYRFLCLKHM